MLNQEIYRIPTIEVETREDLIKIFMDCPPACVFEQVEEVLNPVGLQWNYILTAKINSDNIGTAIVRYKEALFEKPEEIHGFVATWLKESIPSINCWYKGIIKP